MRALFRILFLSYLAVLGIAGSPVRAGALTCGWQKVDGINLFYREGGPANAPTIVFLHGYPLSSIQYAGVMEGLVELESVHVIAVDYPSFGYSDAPDHKAYRYTFDHVADTVRQFLAARGITRYGLFMQDYGVPVGFRPIAAAPGAITTVMVQNGVIHLDGFPAARDESGELRRHWKNRNADVDKRRTEYAKSLPYPNSEAWAKDNEMTPDAMLIMTASVQRPGVIEARNDLWFDYGTNVTRYPAWQATLQRMKVPVLVICGSRDDFFTTPGAVAYLRDAPQAEIHILDAGHFATLDAPGKVIQIMSDFLARHREALSRKPIVVP